MVSCVLLIVNWFFRLLLGDSVKAMSQVEFAIKLGKSPACRGGGNASSGVMDLCVQTCKEALMSRWMVKPLKGFGEISRWDWDWAWSHGILGGVGEVF